MSGSMTMTIRISPEIKDQLSRLAQASKRSSSFLAGEAVTRYVGRELEIVEGILQGLEDARTGNTVSHEDAMAEIWAMLDSRTAAAS